MRFAIAAMAPDERGKISRHGARAECYLVFDEAARLCEVLQNPYKDYDRAVGIRIADYLAEKKIDVVVAANMGTGFTAALDAKGIRYAEREGAIGDIAKDIAAEFGGA